MVGSLEGVRVLELARYQAGPRGGMILSDLGAEVIKIEKLGGEETRRSEPGVKGVGVYFTVSRATSSIVVSPSLTLRRPLWRRVSIPSSTALRRSSRPEAPTSTSSRSSSVMSMTS